MSILKPITDVDREFLALLGESVEDHQKQMLAIAKRVKPEKSERKRLGEFKLNENSTVDDRSEAKKIVDNFVPDIKIKWVPEAYILLRVRATCRCGAQHVYPEGPYLCEKRVHATQDDPSHPKRYTPMRGIEYPRIPARTQIIFRTLTYCESCWRQGPHIIPELTCASEQVSSREPTGPSHSTPSTVSPSLPDSECTLKSLPSANSSSETRDSSDTVSSPSQENQSLRVSFGDLLKSANALSATALDSPSLIASETSVENLDGR